MLVSGFACGTLHLHAQAPDSVAESLLHRMAGAYALLNSYSDSGVVYHYNHGTRDPDSTRFRIFFVRPDLFRFEMTNNVGSPYFPEDYKVLLSDASQSRSWWQSNPQITTNSDVISGIGGFTGISSRSVHNIPSLLQTNFGWQEVLDELSSPRLLGHEPVNGTDCYHLQGVGRGDRQFEVWIGKTDYLVRKVRTNYPEFFDEEIHDEITINQKISSETFNFTPGQPGEVPAKN
jgi:hypothetical protein